MGITIFGLAFLALSTASASPLKRTAIAPNTATCDFSLCSQGHGAAMGCYKIHIGRPFNQGGGCPSIQQNIRDEVTYLGKYQCVDDGSGQTTLAFETPADPTSNIAAIDALQKSYPDVPFQAQRICLMEGSAVPADWPPAETTSQIESRSAADDSAIATAHIAFVAGKDVEVGHGDSLATSPGFTTAKWRR